MSELAPREMRRAWMTAFGNAKLARRDSVETKDLPDASGRKAGIGFVQ
jgi:ATP-dependent Lon protease